MFSVDGLTTGRFVDVDVIKILGNSVLDHSAMLPPNKLLSPFFNNPKQLFANSLKTGFKF